MHHMPVTLITENLIITKQHLIITQKQNQITHLLHKFLYLQVSIILITVKTLI